MWNDITFDDELDYNIYIGFEDEGHENGELYVTDWYGEHLASQMEMRQFMSQHHDIEIDFLERD